MTKNPTLSPPLSLPLWIRNKQTNEQTNLSAKTMILDHCVAFSATVAYTVFRGPGLFHMTTPHLQPVPSAFFFDRLVLFPHFTTIY